MLPSHGECHQLDRVSPRPSQAESHCVRADRVGRRIHAQLSNTPAFQQHRGFGRRRFWRLTLAEAGIIYAPSASSYSGTTMATGVGISGARPAARRRWVRQHPRKHRQCRSYRQRRVDQSGHGNVGGLQPLNFPTPDRATGNATFHVNGIDVLPVRSAKSALTDITGPAPPRSGPTGSQRLRYEHTGLATGASHAGCWVTARWAFQLTVTAGNLQTRRRCANNAVTLPTMAPRGREFTLHSMV